jgi:hypothetical protein
MAETTALDQFIARFQNMRSFNVYNIDDQGEVRPWFDVPGPSVVRDLVIKPHDLETQVQSISVQIQFWGRMEAQCKRVWQIEERNYRRWRDAQLLELSQAPTDPEEAKGWKKPSDKRIEALYRQRPEYNELWQAVERAEEATNAAHAVLEGFRAKKDMLRAHVFRSHEDGQARMSV